MLAPSVFAPGHVEASLSARTDEDVRGKFLEIYKPLRDERLDAYELGRVASAIFHYRPLLSRLLRPTQGKIVVEIGSGLGWKALCWSDLFASYTGIELDPGRSQQSVAVLRRFGKSNSRVITGNAETIFREPRRYGIERIDLLVLYAVLEHLTLPERRSIFELAGNVVAGGGHVLIAESPNRLCRSDSHSFQLPFSEWIPVELLSEYAACSPREDLKTILNASASDRRHETLYRIGRGLSFHEFACFWPKFNEVALLNDGYCTELLNLEPFRREEWDLLSYCVDNQIDVHRMFTRYWVEGLFAKRAETVVRKNAIYLNPQRTTSAAVRERRRHWELDEATIDGDDPHAVEIPNAAIRGWELLLLIDTSRSWGTIMIEGSGGQETSTIDVRTVSQARMPTWHSQAALPLNSFKATGDKIRLRPTAGSSLTFHGILLI
jgi:hypothetical protein